MPNNYDDLHTPQDTQVSHANSSDEGESQCRIKGGSVWKGGLYERGILYRSDSLWKLFSMKVILYGSDSIWKWFCIKVILYKNDSV